MPLHEAHGDEAVMLPPRPIPVVIDPEEEADATALMHRLCSVLYAPDSPQRTRTRAMLCHVYHYAVHDNWFRARDMMLMSHLQEHITMSDIETQILYNRTVVQLGLCAFRQGLIRDTHEALHEVWSSNRVKELLAQDDIDVNTEGYTARIPV